VEKSALIDGSNIRAGDVILGVASSGPHSNGYSLIRRIVERAGNPFDLDIGGVKLADALMAPTTIYVKPLLALLGSGIHEATPASGPRSPAPLLHGMAHITGGGLTENIIRVVPDGLGLALDPSTWTLPPVFDWLQREGNVPNDEMWRTFNCGIGFTVILSHDDADSAGAMLAKHGLASQVIGEVVAAPDDKRVRIR
jgi:phosphoribosylformylglycinamidine cyclo-ligase